MISDFARDMQIDPSIVHSKRFVVHPADYAMMKENVGDVEYLIEFQLGSSIWVFSFLNKCYSVVLKDIQNIKKEKRDG